MGEASGPELSHGDIVGSFALKAIDRMDVKGAAGFRVRAQAALVRQFAQAPVIVFRDEVGERTTVIPFETRGDFLIRNGPARQDRKVGNEIISPTGTEFFRKAGRPRRIANLPAIDMRVLQR